ncbi:uncharacterized protein [Mytilus edulis]|uniref:uncharacterized protein n=1 Tax=Mytilus edulis TaxID=6550 RepID=UPI0039EE304A
MAKNSTNMPDGSLVSGESDKKNGKKLNHFEISHPTDLAAAYHYDKVVGVIKKDTSERSDAEIHQIISWFKKKSDLFNQLNEKIIHDLIKNCSFTTVDRDFVVIKQGDKGDCFFIILNGSVSIHISTTSGYEDERKEGGSTEEQDDKGKKEEGKPKELNRSKFGKYVGKIVSGKSFGELALINPDCIRNATIIADETTDLIVIDRELYNRSIHSFHTKEFEERKHFVETNPLFDGWHPKDKRQLAMSLRKEKLTFESYIVKQGSPFDGLRFILNGQAKLYCDPHMHSMQYPDYYPLPDVDELEKDQVRESLRRELGLDTHSHNKHDGYKPLVTNLHKLSTQDTEKSGTRSPHQHHIELCLICSQELIGDLEVAMDLDTYSYTVNCIQETDIYVLDQKNYERLIEKRNPKVVEKIRSSVLEKFSLRLSWIQDKNDLPLFRYLLYKIEESRRQKKSKKKL